MIENIFIPIITLGVAWLMWKIGSDLRQPQVLGENLEKTLTIVICSDGSVFQNTDEIAEWTEGNPVPGTRRDIEWSKVARVRAKGKLKKAQRLAKKYNIDDVEKAVDSPTCRSRFSLFK